MSRLDFCGRELEIISREVEVGSQGPIFFLPMLYGLPTVNQVMEDD